MEKTEKVRLTLDLPRELHKDIRRAAVEEEVSMKEFIERCVRNCLKTSSSNPEAARQ